MVTQNPDVSENLPDEELAAIVMLGEQLAELMAGRIQGTPDERRVAAHLAVLIQAHQSGETPEEVEADALDLALLQHRDRSIAEQAEEFLASDDE